MILDQITARNLELVEPAPGDDASATLVGAIDETATGMGARLLRSWILRPEISLGEIEDRLDAVAELKSRTIVREELHKELEGILDLERLMSRITLGVATPRDLIALLASLDKIPSVRGLLQGEDALEQPRTRLRRLFQAGRPAKAGCARCARKWMSSRTCATSSREGLPTTLRRMPNDPGVIRRGFHAELDELRDILKLGRQTIAAMEERERKRTGIASLKIRYNQVFGYYIEVSKPNLPLVPSRLRPQADAGQRRAVHFERACRV